MSRSISECILISASYLPEQTVSVNIPLEDLVDLHAELMRHNAWKCSMGLWYPHCTDMAIRITIFRTDERTYYCKSRI